MNVISDAIQTSLSGDYKTAIVIGNFDGIHAGHQQMIKRLLKYANENNLHPALVTFNPHPKCLFSNCDNYLLMSEKEKEKQVADYKIETLYNFCFTDSFAKLSQQDFLDILLNKLNANYILVGKDFRFGYQGCGDVEFLRNKSQQENFVLDVFEDFCIDGQRVSSTLVRAELFAGNMEMVNKLLGRSFYYESKVIKGKQLGRTIGIPTANLAINSEFAMPNGVFVVRVCYENEIYAGVCNIGSKPTVSGKTRLLEVHLFDFEKDIYGKSLKVYPLVKLRDEKKFNSIEELTSQIKNDIANAKYILASQLISD